MSESAELIPKPNNRGVMGRFHRYFVTACILLTELGERLTYYSINANLVIFCTNVLKFDSAGAVMIALIFNGTCYFMPLVCGWISDAVAGKYNVIYGGSLIYIIGTLLLPAVAFDYMNAFQATDLGFSVDARRAYFLVGLALIAIGTGAIKVTVGPFGAQQLEDLGEQAVQSFFIWYYWFINVGSAIAFSVVAYVQQEIGFDIGFLIPACSMVVATVVFVSGRPWYFHALPKGSVLSDAYHVIACALERRDGSVIRHRSFLEPAKESNGGKFEDDQVEGVKSFLHVIPIFGFLIIYWTIYAQMSSTYLLQGERMNLSVGSFKLPAASLNIFNTLIILLLVPVMDRIIYPALAACGFRLSQLKRIGIGLALSGLSVVAAGLLEIARRNELHNSGGMTQNVGGTMYNASHMSIMYQVPQFVLVGASEVFASITGLEFAYSQSPSSMQGIMMSLNLITTGLGNYVGSALVAIINRLTDDWFPDEINNGHVEYFLFLLAGIMLVNFLGFLPVAISYEYRSFGAFPGNGASRQKATWQDNSEPTDDGYFSTVVFTAKGNNAILPRGSVEASV